MGKIKKKSQATLKGNQDSAWQINPKGVAGFPAASNYILN
jgi:hypothetical protein